MRMHHAPYGGLPGGQEMSPMNARVVGPEGDRMIAEQSVVLGKVLATWNEEKKSLLRKYKGTMLEMRKIQDAANSLIQTKGPLLIQERERIESEFNGRAALANDMVKAIMA